jgi:hypothetical protein
MPICDRNPSEFIGIRSESVQLQRISAGTLPLPNLRVDGGFKFDRNHFNSDQILSEPFSKIKELLINMVRFRSRLSDSEETRLILDSESSTVKLTMLASTAMLHISPNWSIYLCNDLRFMICSPLLTQYFWSVFWYPQTNCSSCLSFVNTNWWCVLTLNLVVLPTGWEE